MIYLTYDEYSQKLGGICDVTAFNRYIDRACGIIDNATHIRIECMAEVPQRAKALCRDLVEYLANDFREELFKTIKINSNNYSLFANLFQGHL